MEFHRLLEQWQKIADVLSPVGPINCRIIATNRQSPDTGDRYRAPSPPDGCFPIAYLAHHASDNPISVLLWNEDGSVISPRIEALLKGCGELLVSKQLPGISLRTAEIKEAEPRWLVALGELADANETLGGWPVVKRWVWDAATSVRTPLAVLERLHNENSDWWRSPRRPTEPPVARIPWPPRQWYIDLPDVAQLSCLALAWLAFLESTTLESVAGGEPVPPSAAHPFGPVEGTKSAIAKAMGYADESGLRKDQRKKAPVAHLVEVSPHCWMAWFRTAAKLKAVTDRMKLGHN